MPLNVTYANDPSAPPPPAPSPATPATPATPTSTDRFFDVLTSFQRAAALRAALEIDLFTAVAAGHTTPEALATACRVAPRGARILADYLVVNAFLAKQNGHYHLTPESALYLDRRSPTYLGDTVEFVQSPHLWRQFGDLTQRVRHGGAPASDDNALAPNHEFWVRFAHGMGRNTQPAAEALARSLLPALPQDRPIRILDIAAGHGMYGIAFARLSPRVQVSAQDWPNVLQVALHNAHQAAVADRYTLLPGNAFDIEFNLQKGDPDHPGGYDLAIIANFLHHFDAGTNVKLLRKVHAALNPGGLAVTLEFAPNDDRVSPPAHAAFAIFMLATTPAGDAYTVNEIGAMYTQAGFTGLRGIPNPVGIQRIVLGRKA